MSDTGTNAVRSVDPSGADPSGADQPGAEVESPYRATARPGRVRVHHLRELKERGERWPMLTAYDVYTAEIFDEAGIPVLLVGDSAGNNVFGYANTIPVTVDELVPLVKAVVRGATNALVVADLPFGSYQVSVEQALTTAIRFLKEGAHAVKLEGGAHFAPHVRALVAAGIPVMGHIGFTPQSEHALGGFRVQGRSAAAADAMIADATALQEAGAFAVVLEMVPALVAKRITAELAIPTIGIGAGPDTDAQVLVWQDMMGMNRGRTPRFVKQYADVGSVLVEAARRFGDEVRGSVYPDTAHSYD